MELRAFFDAITLAFHLFSQSKKKRYRIEIERAVRATKMHRDPFHPIIQVYNLISNESLIQNVFKF